MRLFIYEPKNIQTTYGAVEVVVVAATDRAAADKAMLDDDEGDICDQEHLDRTYKVKEADLTPGTFIFRGYVFQ